MRSSPRRPFELLLFSTDVATVQSAVQAGIDGIVVDWEQNEKKARQSGSDTEINHDTHEDLNRIRAATKAPIICRVNNVGRSAETEAELAIADGATEILLPMVRAAQEVEALLNVVRDRCGVGILIETIAAVERAVDFARLPLTRVYVGLNDLAIERRSTNIFEAVTDGTIDRLRPLFATAFGFGGLTLPDGGWPVPCRLLIGEMARLKCNFSFLRRSFRRDISGRLISEGLAEIRAAVVEACNRSDEEMVRDHLVLEATVTAWRRAEFV